MYIIALAVSKLSTANVHIVVHKRFKKPTTHIVIILIQLFMRLDPSLGMPLRRQTSKLLIRIVRVLIDTDPINIVLNGIFAILELAAETWGHSVVLVTVVCIAIVLIKCTYVKIYGKS